MVVSIINLFKKAVGLPSLDSASCKFHKLIKDGTKNINRPIRTEIYAT